MLYDKIRHCKRLEDETDLTLKTLNECHLDVNDIDALRAHLKGNNINDEKFNYQQSFNQDRNAFKLFVYKVQQKNYWLLTFSDRRQGDDIVAEVDDGINKMQSYVNSLEAEIKERSVLIELLEQADSFYNTQKGEAKVVANVS